MTITSMTCSDQAQTKQQPSLAVMIAERYRAMRERRKARCAMGELRALSIHTLKDIGLHRTEVSSVVCVAQSDRRRNYAGH